MSGESYPQYCLRCKTVWRLLGDLSDERRECSECGQEAAVATFFKWWVVANLDTEISVRVRVPSDLSAAVDELARVSEKSRRRELVDLIGLKPTFLEDGDRRE